MYAHIVPRFYLHSWANTLGKNSLYFFDKSLNGYVKGCKNSDNVFGKNDYYYFYLFPKDEKAKGSQSTRQFLLGYYQKAFSSFFEKMDRDVFANKILEIDGLQISKNQTFEFVNQYYVTKSINIYERKDNIELAISKTKIKAAIENEWNSGDKETEESFLSIRENEGRSAIAALLKALEERSTEDIQKLHKQLSSFVSVQMTRNPLDATIKVSIDESVALIKNVLQKRGLNELMPEAYSEEDVKAICDVQMLIYQFSLENGNGEFRDVLTAVESRFKDSVFFYLRRKKHPFVIGDNPVVRCALPNQKAFLFLPISPDWGVLIAKSSEIKEDKILESNSSVVDFLNWCEFNSAKTGIISKDRLFVNKEREFPRDNFTKAFKQARVKISDWFLY